MSISVAQQTARERSVQVSATVQQTPPQINFSWPADNAATEYKVYRKNINAPVWGTEIATLAGNAATFMDQNVSVGQGYEYAFFKHGFDNVTTTACVPSGANLQFDIVDMYGIGLCCSFGQGYYEVAGCGQTYAAGDDFEWAATHNFTACSNNPCTDITVTIAPDMFPNSTSWTLKDADTGTEYANSGGVGVHIAPRPAYGYIYAGIKVPEIEYPGTILLVVESSIDNALPIEIAQLQEDHIRDGWKVKKIVVNATDAVTTVRSGIQNIYATTPDLKSVMLLGHVPVPYSGDMYPDTHSEFRGAWSADTYYGELNGTWTDNTVNRTTAFFPENHNVPGDGKFDQTEIPTPMELQVGRVDFYDLPLFADDEITLTKKYLDKSSAFKNGLIPTIRRGLIDDNFGVQFAAPAASGFRNFAPMFGASNINEVDYETTLASQNYLWAYGCGPGSHVSVQGVTTTGALATANNQAVFNMFFGSQLGDWNHNNNILRAALAQGLTLTNTWAGNPSWQFHQMAMGYNIGFSAIRTANSSAYLPGPQLVHVALMGDPTLRMHPVKPVSNIVITIANNDNNLTWTAPANETVLGYNIYRASSMNSNFVKLNSQLVTTTSYVDGTPLNGDNVYMVRTVKLETTGSGTYCNMALGRTATNFFIDNPLSIHLEAFNVEAFDCDNKLEWNMNAVDDIDFFQLERSFDGSNFETIKMIEADGKTNHQYLDRNLEAIQYYRLKTYNPDGSFEYSAIVSVENDCHGKKYFLEAFPNPASIGDTELTVQFATKSDEVRISLIDIHGQLLQRRNYQVEVGTNKVILDIKDLTNGIYFIYLEDNQLKNRSVKFMRSDLN